MTYETVTFEARDAVGVLTLNRPKLLNAIDTKMVQEINAVLDAVAADDDIRVLVLAGAGRAFCAGFDLKESAGKERKGPVDWRPELERDFNLIMRFWHLRKPTISAVHGYCLAGGCEMALACDITIAAEGTMFGEPELRFGSGMIALLMPWLTGPKQAKELLLTGNDRVPADRALAIGLINKVVAEGEHLDAALAMARQIAVMFPETVALTKMAINRTYEIMGMGAALDMGLDIDVEIESLETPERLKFQDISKREGLKAAIAWRDSRFGESGDGKE
ncbi:MAG: enoyl-CoA hydratase/isomerase family protein [Proteobacteria bacterium]|nr:enoyl-CoA hydratase/isomerase family protein [Pseudomonadota bacterium]